MKTIKLLNLHTICAADTKRGLALVATRSATP